MSDWRCGISTGCFYKTPILDALPVVRDGGFVTIEVCSFPAHLDYHDQRAVEKAAAMMKSLGMDANSFHAPFADTIDISSPDPGHRADSVRELNTACDAAAALRASYVVLHPGPEQAHKPPPEERYQRMRHAAESLNAVASHCRLTGLTLLLENMLPHLLFGHVSDLMFLLGAIRETNVGTCLDTGHAFLSKDLRTVVHKLSGHLRMLHVNDNMGDRDAHLSPGEGAIDWTSLFRQLRQWNFHGPLILELADSGEAPEKIMERARNARSYLREIIDRPAGAE
ncbi:MAG: sugar phosphate isomerase/epimerase family protein [Luteolibacter sp.]|jgi:sugar phosphate isomerase/epimerase|nr:sugar phosphate isomerase/epimerase family protein [Luteolibacter sp.]